MTDRLRDLAGKIDKATPGPWEVGECHESKAEVNANGKEICRVCVMRTWSGEEKQPDSQDTAEAICLARNEAPALLREAADEIERLQRVVDQAIEFGGLKLIIRDFREIIQDGDGGWDYAIDYPDLASELECQRGEK